MKASLIVLVALAATALMRRRSAAVRHWVLSTAIVCAAVMPLLELAVPSWQVDFGRSRPRATATPQNQWIMIAPTLPPRPFIATSGTPSGSEPLPPPADPGARATTWLPAIWLAGTGISLFVLMVGLGRLAWIASRAQRLSSGRWVELAHEIAREYGITRTIQILQSDHPTLLVTWGLVQPKVILPRAARDWPEDRMRIVISHELAHIQRGDWLLQMTAELVRSVYWFNPLLWVAGRRLRQESEHACDDAVLTLGVDGTEYAAHLLDLARDVTRLRARWSPGLPAPAIARPSSLERRVSAMLNTRLNRTPLTGRARAAAASALLAMTIPLAGFGQTFVNFSGTVVDPNGRITPGATLTLSSAQRDEKRQVRSDSGGRFEFAGVPAGDYVLETQLPGFRNLRENVTLASRDVQRTLTLEVGMLEETITIVTGPPASSSTPSRAGNRGSVRIQPEYDPCSASPVGGCLKPPTKVADVKPQYPQSLSDAQVGAVVVLSCRIGADGSVIRAQLADPADRVDPAFAQAAIAAVNQWQFTPTQLGGVPIEVDMKVTANFVVR